jgi:hypothetical protein
LHILRTQFLLTNPVSIQIWHTQSFWNFPVYKQNCMVSSFKLRFLPATSVHLYGNRTL